jgi:hypothetical protein
MSYTINPLTPEEIEELNSNINSTITLGPSLQSGFGAVPSVTLTTGAIGGTGYTYTNSTAGNVMWQSTPNTVWTTSNTGWDTSTLTAGQSGKITLKGKDADLEINGKSLKETLEALEERLNWMQPNPELEKEWDELRRLGNRYRAMEKKCREKAKMWEQLKKVQPKSRD